MLTSSKYYKLLIIYFHYRSNTVDPIYERIDAAEYEEMTVLHENMPTTDCTAYVATKATASTTSDYENTNFSY